MRGAPGDPPHRPGLDRRRFLLTSLAGAIAAPLAAGAEQAGKVYRIGILHGGSPLSDMVGPHPASRSVSALLQRLSELGYVYGDNLVTEARSAEGMPDRLPALAAELVRIPVDVIVASGPPAARAAQQATRTIPIVIAGMPDPVGSGIVGSLARPGGNVTGLSSAGGPEIVGKRLELLKEAVPRISRVTYIASQENWESPTGAHTQAAARALGLMLLHTEVSNPQQFPDAFATITRQRPHALLVQPSGANNVRRKLIADYAATQRLPAMYGFRDFAEAGGLMAYGQSIADLNRRAATYVDKILKGAKPADLPVEQATKFELIINLRTAKALGLTIPPSLLARADQVIE
jgi:putative tryptophan/tyrosine transport system substrate-binding protein